MNGQQIEEIYKKTTSGFYLSRCVENGTIEEDFYKNQLEQFSEGFKLGINEICNKVCGEIKEGWIIQIHLENGAGYAELIDPTGHLPEFDSADMSIFEQVESLLAASKVLPE